MPKIPEATFVIDRQRGRSLQAQIREAVVSAVHSGHLPPGAALPSTRRLAGQLQVSRLTVSLAYQELVAQGYLLPSERRGFRVSSEAPVARLAAQAVASEASAWSPRLTRRFSIARPIRKPLDWRAYPYPFLYGQMDVSLFDLAAWRDCVRRAHSRNEFDFMAGDFAASDDMELVRYISSQTLPRRGIQAGPNEILVTMGAQNALWIAIQMLLGPGKRSAYENPGHPDIYASLRLSGASIAPVAVDGHGLPPDALPEDVDVVIVTPSHQAPTAVRMPRERRLRLLELAEARDFVIIEDDYEFEMSYLEPPSPALRALDRRGRVLYVGSFTKSLFPGLRLGYLVGPPAFIAEARALRALILRHPPGHLQRTVANFLSLGHYDSHIRRMRLEYARRYEVMIGALRRAGLALAGQSNFGGSCFWIEGPAGTDADALAARLQKKGVLIESGTPFFEDQAPPCRFFRMAFSSIAADRIEAGVRLVADELS
ncbi:PLP-dependent aminotransferase family protein [soil metagenome]